MQFFKRFSQSFAIVLKLGVDISIPQNRASDVSNRLISAELHNHKQLKLHNHKKKLKENYSGLVWTILELIWL